VIFNRSLLNTLRKRELDTAGEKIGRPYTPSSTGEYIAGTY
jgi:hypothetical protein